MILIFIKAIIGWLVFMFIGTNLLGLIVRSLAQPAKEENIDDQSYNDLFQKRKRIGIFISVFFCIVAIIYFYILYHFWNIGVALAGAMVMFSRIPDLLFEIKTGKKISLITMPKRPIDFITIIIMWAALPVLWYSLYCMK